MRESIDNYIVFYNTQRPHAAIKYKTPDRLEECGAGECNA
ncbi:integrase core domain-containing protein [Ruminococcaceae bacterium OttesenSCG-928-A11]|nr:integrase core domain-containing protein [Ruminococcaceae bacterium OttesenSCG-928-A11]